MIEPVPIFIGFDQREAAAYHVCCQSIITRSSVPVAFYPLALNLLANEYTETHGDGSNAFIYSRFLVPAMMGYGVCHKHALFIDGDMLVRGDIAQLWAMRRADLGVQVVKHDYKTRYPTKYLGARNDDYPRKNWSSVILWNCSFYPNRSLTPEFVSTQPGSFLHRFQWLKDEQIGELPATWNHLCMEYAPNPAAKLLHYTIGLPGFIGYSEQEGAEEWRSELTAACAPVWA